MRTIFVTIFQGAEAKNILRTDIYKHLIANPELRLVFLASNQDRIDYYRKEFNAPNVVYEIAEMGKMGFWNRLFSNLKFHLLNTETADLRREMILEETHNQRRYRLSRLVNKIFARPLIRKIVRLLDYFLVRDQFFAALFDKYRPSLVFCAHLFDDQETQLLREAKRRGIKTIGFVNSWDKMTARGIMRLLPDQLIVFNELVKDEAMRYADMPTRKIIVAGIPQYDWHVNYQPLSKGEFFRKKNLDVSKKLVVYAPMGKTFSNSDWDIIDLLHTWMVDGQVRSAQLLVRFQPNDFFDEAEMQKRPWLIYDRPGIRFSKERGVDWDMSFNDIRGLTDTLTNADLFICYASSMSVDAAIFDKPVINIDFEVRPKELMSKSPTYFYKMTHYAKAARTGGIRYPKSKEEFLKDINDYLDNPKLDDLGRHKLVGEQCWKLDGHSSERVAKVILENL